MEENLGLVRAASVNHARKADIARGRTWRIPIRAWHVLQVSSKIVEDRLRAFRAFPASSKTKRERPSASFALRDRPLAKRTARSLATSALAVAQQTLAALPAAHVQQASILVPTTSAQRAIKACSRLHKIKRPARSANLEKPPLEASVPSATSDSMMPGTAGVRRHHPERTKTARAKAKPSPARRIHGAMLRAPPQMHSASPVQQTAPRAVDLAARAIYPAYVAQPNSTWTNTRHLASHALRELTAPRNMELLSERSTPNLDFGALGLGKPRSRTAKRDTRASQTKMPRPFH